MAVLVVRVLVFCFLFIFGRVVKLNDGCVQDIIICSLLHFNNGCGFQFNNGCDFHLTNGWIL